MSGGTCFDWTTAGAVVVGLELARQRGGVAEPPPPRTCPCGTSHRRAASARFPWLCTRCARKAEGLPRDARARGAA